MPLQLANLAPRKAIEAGQRAINYAAKHREKIAEMANEATDTLGTVGSSFGWGYLKYAFPKVGTAKLLGTKLPLVPLASIGVAGMALLGVGGKFVGFFGIPAKGVIAGEAYEFGKGAGERHQRRATIKGVEQRQANGWFDPVDQVWFN